MELIEEGRDTRKDLSEESEEGKDKEVCKADLQGRQVLLFTIVHGVVLQLELRLPVSLLLFQFTKQKK